MQTQVRVPLQPPDQQLPPSRSVAGLGYFSPRHTNLIGKQRALLQLDWSSHDKTARARKEAASAVLYRML